MFYNFTQIKIPAVTGAAKIVLKGCNCGESQVFDTIDGGNFIIDTDNSPAGKYHYQQLGADGQIIRAGCFELRQNLQHADADFDPRSRAEITLEAIDAMLAGRATQQQRSVSVDGKAIQYSSLTELLQWREHFQRLVMVEQGQTPPKRELYRLKGV